MIEIKISARDKEKNIDNILNVSISEEISNIKFEKYKKTYSFDTQELDQLILNYTENYGSGVTINMRELYNELELSEKDQVNRDLARIFIISSRWMHFGQIRNFSVKQIIINTIKNGIDDFLNKNNILEWSGDTGNQPGIYYINKDYIENYKEAIEKFYKLGLLYKYDLEICNEKFVNFIFPFVNEEDNNIKKIDLFPHFNIWNKIIIDRNKDIIDFINGTRNKW